MFYTLLTTMITTYTLEEQKQLLEKVAIARGYKSWAEYKAAELDYSDPIYDREVS